MPEYQTKNLKIGISKMPESSFNTTVNGFTNAATAGPSVNNFLGMLTTGRGFPLPDYEKFDDKAKVGGCGSGFPKTQRSGYALPPTMEINEDVNTDIVALLARRTFGGPDTVPAGADILEPAVAFRHKWVMQNPLTDGDGRQLDSSTVVYALGGADFAYSGVCGESFKLDQSGATDPMATISLVGSGKYKRLRDMSNAQVPSQPAAGVVERPSVPCPTTQHYMHGAETSLEFTDLDTDGTTPRTVSLTATQRMRNFSYTLQNNLKTDDKRAGDTRVDSTTTKRGWFVGRLLFNDPTAMAECTVMLDDNLWEWADAMQDIPITNFTYKAKGDYIGASTTNQYSVILEIPKCFFRAVRGGDDGGDATITFSIFTTEESSTFGLTRMYVINDVATAIS